MWRPGDLVDGRFVLERVAGSGGRGAVWRAVDITRRDAVALKLVPGPGGIDPLGAVRSEIDALANVRHEAVVACRSFGRADERTAYLALSWIDGEPLSARIARRPLTVGDVLVLGGRIAGALGAIHGAGLVHADLKPQNILLPGGDPAAAVVVDLGIARHVTASAGGPAVGTPAYMAPEQASGDVVLDARADLFALGAVLHEALTGRPTFGADQAAAILTRVLFEEPPPLLERRPDVPAPLDTLIRDLLAKDRDRRPPDAARVQARLAGIRAPAREDAPVAVGGDEVRALSVAVVVDPDGGLDATTTAVELRRALGAAARVVALEPPGVAIAFEGGIATDRAVAAARAATVAHTMTGLPVGVASGSGLVRDTEITGAAAAAARALADAGPGVWLDEITAGLVAPRFYIADEPSGRRLDRERRSDGQRTVLGRLTPLCGRDRELGMLAALAEECAAEQEPRVALVTAPPGLGKSRLRRELVRRLEDGDAPFAIWLGRGDPVRAGAPLAILAELIRSSLIQDVAASSEGGDEQTKIFDVAQRGGIADPDRVTDFLAELLGLPPDGAPSPQLAAARANPILMNDQLRAAVIDWIGVAARRPLALILEDFHWGDAATVKFLDAALRQLRDRAILVVALGRPAMLDTVPGPFAGHHPLVVRLGPLSARAAAQLVRHALPDADEAATQRIVDRAAGNPFYVEELIRQVAASPEDRGELPATVVSMVQARLDDLGAAERRVLRAAAVLGPRFTRGAVAALLGVPSADADVAGWLDELARRELVVRRRPSPLPAEDELAFVHDLVREAADALLTEEDRAAAHRAAAAWWEQRPGADPVALATHWERGGAPLRAATWHRRAAEVALAANDFAAALASLRRAGELGAPADAAACLVAAEAHAWRGELADAAEAGEAAMQITVDGAAAWCRGLATAVTGRGRLGDHDAVLVLAERALATEPAPGADAAFLSCLAAVGRQLFHAARYQEAARAIALVRERAGDLDAIPPLVSAQVHGLLAAAARHRGDLADDLAGYRAVLAGFEAAGDRRSACNTRVSVAFAMLELGDDETAEAQLTAALADAAQLGLAPVATRARQNLGLVWLCRGRLAEAADVLDRVIGESREQENARFEGWTRIYRARVALAAGDLAVARTHCRAATVLLETSPPALAGARAVWAQVLVALGQAEAAVAEARAAVATCDELGGIEEFEALARLALAEALGAAGDVAARDAAIRRAAERLDERAAAIGDPRLRASFLERVDENRRTRELFAGLPAA